MATIRHCRYAWTLLCSKRQLPLGMHNMSYRDIWTEADFVDMGWHDVVVYSMRFPQADQTIRFDIDYIFKWHWKDGTVSGWDVAPCTLQFNNVSNLAVSLEWQMQGDTSILDITRNNGRSSKGKLMLWDYQIDFDVGQLRFTASGFTQAIREQALFSTSQFLGRKE